MRYHETKIGRIIEEEFDSRVGNVPKIVQTYPPTGEILLYFVIFSARKNAYLCCFDISYGCDTQGTTSSTKEFDEKEKQSYV